MNPINFNNVVLPPTHSSKESQDLSTIVESWLQKFPSFVTHAVFEPKNIISVIEHGICPAEQVLREKGIVEYEQQYTGTGRGETKLPTLTDEDFKDLYEFEKLIYQDTLYGFKPNGKAETPKYFTPKIGKKIFEFIQKIEPLVTKYETTLLMMMIAYDQRKNPSERVDQKLSLHYRYFIENMPRYIEKFAKNSSDYFDMDIDDDDSEEDPEQAIKNLIDKILEDIRFKIFPFSKLNAQIRAAKKEIFWSYGTFVILKGVDSSLEKRIKNCLGEQLFPSPHQNQGQFFSIALDDPSVLVLAPRLVLHTHKETLDRKLVQRIAIEDLTSSERSYFKVPNWVLEECSQGQ